MTDEQVKNIDMAIKSLNEEMEAVNLYNQRMHATEDAELKSILKHNRDEEMEHAAMMIEWLRRQMPEYDHELKDVLFQEGPITGQH